MNRPHVVSWIIGLVAAAVVGPGSGCRRVDEAPTAIALPEVRPRPELPAAFDREAQRRRDEVIAADFAPEALRNLARLYHANRQLGEAQQCYDLLVRHPDAVTALDHYLQADLARQANDLERARGELQQVVAAQPDYLPARLGLAEILSKTGQEQAAAAQYAAVLDLAPEQPRAVVGLARLELQRGEEDAAVTRLEDFMAAQPESTSGAALLAQVLRRRGELDRAAALTEVSEQRPEPAPADPWLEALWADSFDAELLGLQAEDHLRAGDGKRAQVLLDRIRQFDPASPIPSLVQGQAEALARHDEAAVGHLREALAKGGEPERICPSITQALLNLHRTDEAVTLAAEYHHKLPASRPIARAYADALLARGDDAQARPVLEKVVQAEPTLQRPNMELARILWSAGERDAAADCLRRVAAAHADDVPSRALLGEYYLQQADAASALLPLQEALAVAIPGTPAHDRLSGLLATACVQSGTAAAAQGRLDEAADHFEQATRVLPAEPEAYAALADVCVQQKQFVRAADALQRLAALQPGNPTIRLSLGDVLHRQGRRDAARAEWERARVLVAPDDARLRQALEARLRGEFTEEIFR